MNVIAKTPMTIKQFLAWGEAQPEGRYELVKGEIKMMAPERKKHNRVKYFVARALDDALLEAGINGVVYTDGVGVKTISGGLKETLREPDASIQLGPELDDGDSLVVDNPFLVVEVISPSSADDDETLKLAEYAGVHSIMHYLVIDPDANNKSVIHFRRLDESRFETQILKSGKIVFDPPGFEVDITSFYSLKNARKG